MTTRRCGVQVEIRRLYDICNVLTSLKMLEKIRRAAQPSPRTEEGQGEAGRERPLTSPAPRRLPDTNKPAFKWLGVTNDTHLMFDADHQRGRTVRQYGGGIPPKKLPALTDKSGGKRDAEGGAAGEPKAKARHSRAHGR